MSRSWLERAYARLGPRYLERGLFLQQQFIYPVLVASVAALSSYVRMSFREFVSLSLLGCGLQFVYSLLTIPAHRRATRPVSDWLAGDRSDPRAAAEAWRAAAGLPSQLVRRYFLSATLGLAVWSIYLLWSLYLVWELKLPAYSIVLVDAGIAVVVSYVAVLVFFGTERLVRPVLEELSEALHGELPSRVPGLSLRARLLAALPAINVITAVTADAIVRGGDAELSDLALVVVIAAAMAASVSFVLTLMLSRSIAEPITELRDATKRVGKGDFETRVAVVTSDETGELARSFNEMAAGLAERERIRAALGTYVDHEVAEHVLREGTSLAGEEVAVTVMFLDVRDFTGFASRASAPEVVATLNRLFELVVPVVHAQGGHVDKFVGDGLLAVFGAPRRLEDHADKALAASLEIARRVEENFEGALAIGIGLNSGTVVAGNVGGAGRLEFSVIGDAVNVAARVEAATRQTGDAVLIAERTRQLIRDPGEGFEERPEVMLKGKQDRVTLYAPRRSVSSGHEPNSLEGSASK